MKEIRYCPVCREELEIVQGRKYCQHCKTIFFIQYEMQTDSPILSEDENLE